MRYKQEVEATFKKCCEMCENYSIETECEDKEKCPIYSLYLKALGRIRYTRYDDYKGSQGYTDFDEIRQEMI